jgi:ArsR family transcriptional regulator
VTASAPVELARQFRALGDETRLRIIDCLAHGECCVCELMETLALPQSLLSFHLRVLKQAGLVADRRQGRWSYYVLREPALRQLAVTARELGKSAEKRRGKRSAC